MADPIWKDKLVTLANNPGLYRIIEASTLDVVYVGKAWRRPGEANNSVRINDPCADYLYAGIRVFPTISQAEFTSNNLLNTSFIVQEWDDVSEEWGDIDEYVFDWDWSYEYSFLTTSNVRSFPIDGRIDSRQPIFFSIYEDDVIVAKRYFKNGTSSNVSIALDDYDSGVGVFLPKTWTDLVKVEIKSTIYQVVTSCAKYALYYINPYGGWDSYLIRGEVKEADNLTRHNRKTEYVNTNIQNRGEDNYLTEIDKTWVVNSGVLTEQEAKRMPFLLNSNFVYLYDFALESFIPVVITDTITEYKTLKGEGLRMINYVITLRLAQNRIAR